MTDYEVHSCCLESFPYKTDMLAFICSVKRDVRLAEIKLKAYLECKLKPYQGSSTAHTMPLAIEER